MGSIRIYEGMPPLTEEQIAELDALKYREIDLSDIPEMTDEEFERAMERKRSRLREKNLKIAGKNPFGKCRRDFFN